MTWELSRVTGGEGGEVAGHWNRVENLGWRNGSFSLGVGREDEGLHLAE